VPALMSNPPLVEVIRKLARSIVRLVVIDWMVPSVRSLISVIVPVAPAKAEAKEANCLLLPSFATGLLPLVISSSLPCVEAITTLLNAYSFPAVLTVSVRATFEEGSHRHATGLPSALVWILVQVTGVSLPSL